MIWNSSWKAGIALAVLASVCACGSKTSSNDSGTSTGDGGSPNDSVSEGGSVTHSGGGTAGSSAPDSGGSSSATGAITLGSYCAAVGKAFCTRIDDCMLETFADCLAQFEGACCSVSSCSQQLPSSTAERQAACSTAFADESCTDASAGKVPAACTR